MNQENGTTEEPPVLTPQPDPVLPGDVNGDGEVNRQDYILLRKYLSGEKADINESNSDVNGDGIINTMDLIRLESIVSNE